MSAVRDFFFFFTKCEFVHNPLRFSLNDWRWFLFGVILRPPGSNVKAKAPQTHRKTVIQISACGAVCRLLYSQLPPNPHRQFSISLLSPTRSKLPRQLNSKRTRKEKKKKKSSTIPPQLHHRSGKTNTHSPCILHEPSESFIKDPPRCQLEMSRRPSRSDPSRG